MDSIQGSVKVRTPVNIAIIKYWGKKDEELKIPLNDSISGTLDTADICTETEVSFSTRFEEDELIINEEKQDLTNSPARWMIEHIRSLAPNPLRSSAKAHIVSTNNFPTAAGLASSASGFAGLAFALGHAYEVTDRELLSAIARKGSGSACRSLYGGFVQWYAGEDHESSMSHNIFEHTHWPDMRVVICVVDDSKKDVSSTLGMARSVATSDLLKHRAKVIVPDRIGAIKKAISIRDFQTFAEITMQESNQFHAICLDTYPPIFYLNETSKQIIKICSIINEFYGLARVAYTFDAGPNACIYLLGEFVSEFIEIIQLLFPSDGLPIKGRGHHKVDIDPSLRAKLSSNVQQSPGKIKYIINTSIGKGPERTDLPCKE